MILSSSQLRDLFVFQFSSLFFILFFSFPCVFFGQTQNAKTIHKNNDSYNNNNNKRERENVKEENKILWKTRCRVICLMNYIVIYLFCDCLTWRFVLHFSVFFFVWFTWNLRRSFYFVCWVLNMCLLGSMAIIIIFVSWISNLSHTAFYSVPLVFFKYYSFKMNMIFIFVNLFLYVYLYPYVNRFEMDKTNNQ